MVNWCWYIENSLCDSVSNLSTHIHWFWLFSWTVKWNVTQRVILANRFFWLTCHLLWINDLYSNVIYSECLYFYIITQIAVLLWVTCKIAVFDDAFRHIGLSRENRKSLLKSAEILPKEDFLLHILVLISSLYDKYQRFCVPVKYRHFTLRIWPLTLTFDLDRKCHDEKSMLDPSRIILWDLVILAQKMCN